MMYDVSLLCFSTPCDRKKNVYDQKIEMCAVWTRWWTCDLDGGAMPMRNGGWWMVPAAPRDRADTVTLTGDTTAVTTREEVSY